MKKHFFIIIFTLSILFVAKSQTGTPPITGFGPKIYNGSSDIGLLYQSKRGLWYMAGSGQYVLEYDGVTWKKIPVLCGIPDNIVEDKYGNLFVSDLYNIDITRLKPDKQTGNWVAEHVDIEIPDSITTNNIYMNFKKIDDEIYCYLFNPNNTKLSLVYKYDGKIFKAINIKSPETLITNYLLNKKGVAICKYHSFLYDIETLQKDSLRIEPAILPDIYDIVEYSPTELVIVTMGNGVWKYNLKNHNFTEFGPKATNKTLEGIRLMVIKKLHNNNWALSTIGEGLFILDKDGNIIRNITMREGLSSNIILRTYQDNQDQLWAGLFSGGVNRIDIQAPVDVWTEKNGVLGSSVRTITNFKGFHLAKTVTHVVYYDDKTNSWKPIKDDVQEDFLMLQKLKLANKQPHLFMGAYSTLYEIDKAPASSKWKMKKIKLPNDFGNVYGVTNNPDNLNKIYVWSHKELVYFRYDQSRKIHAKHIASLADKQLNYELMQCYNNSLWTTQLDDKLRPIRLDMRDDKVSILPFDSARITYVDSAVQIINKTNDSVFTVQKDMKTVYNEKLSKILADYDNEEIEILNFGENNLYIKLPTRYFFCNILRKNKAGNYERDFLLEQILSKYHITNINTDEYDKNIVWVSTTEGILKVNIAKSIVANHTENDNFVCYIRQVTLNSDSVIFNGNFTAFCETQQNEEQCVIVPHQLPDEIMEFDYEHNTIGFNVAAPFFIEEQQIEYAFMLEGHDNKWTKTKLPVKEYVNLPIGNYTFKAKAINYLGKESKITTYKFRILPPWYKTWFAYFVYAFVFIGVSAILFSLYTRQLRRRNEYLEQMVKQRTEEISKANTALKEQNNEILRQKDLIDQRNKEINLKNDNILASINYAANIQAAILPFEERISTFVSNYFIFYKPRDIISGDFYWIEKSKDKVIIAIADCTGHGVPGAFMSILGSNGITDTVFQQNIIEPHLILEHLHKYIFSALKQEKTHNSDGMDIAIVVYDKSNKTLEFAGARRPLYIVKNNEVSRIRGDRMGLGGSDPRNQRSYTKHVIDIAENTTIYMASDGFQDQMGGPEERKFMGHRFEALISEISSLPMGLQKDLVEKRLNEWKGNCPQIDDILVFGMKLS